MAWFTNIIATYPLLLELYEACIGIEKVNASPTVTGNVELLIRELCPGARIIR
jgi:hypothetical protein